MKLNREFSWIFIVPLLLLVVWLASMRLTIDIYWRDEIFTMRRLGMDGHSDPISPYWLLRRIYQSRWPPMHYAVLPVSSFFLGWTEYATRLLSLFVGLLNIAIVYRLGKDMVSGRVGLFAAIILGLSAFYIHYLHEARGYMLYVFFVVASVWLYWRLIRTKSYTDKLIQGAFVICLAALLYTHYLAPIAFVFIAIYHLLVVRRDPRWFIIFRRMRLAALLDIPWLIIAFTQFGDTGDVPSSLDTGTLLQAMSFGFGNAVPVLIPVLLVGAVLFLRGRTAGFVALWLLVTFVLGMATNSVADFLFHIRHLIGLLVPLCFVIALLIEYVYDRRRWLGVGILAVWCAAGIWAYLPPTHMNSLPNHDPGISYDAMYTIIDTVNTCVQPEDAIVFHINNRPVQFESEFDDTLTYYFYGLASPFVQVNVMDNLSELSDLELQGDYSAKVSQLTQNAAHTWYFTLTDLPRRDLIDTFEDMAQERYAYCGQVLEHPGALGYVYSDDRELSCLATVTLPDCTPDLIQP